MARRAPAGYAEEESIFNLIPQASHASSRPSLYRSKYPHDTPPTGSTFGKASAAAATTANLQGDYENKPATHRHKQDTGSFGPKSLHYADPTSFQTAQAQPTLPPPTRFEYTTRTKPALDSHHAPTSATSAARTASAVRGATKNFISENALAVIMADARRPARGDIDYLRKEDFGKTPAYLQKVKTEIAAEKDYIRRVMDAEAEEATRHQPKTHVLPEEERLHLLTQLKLKWQQVNAQYGQQTHMVVLDTAGKVRRKEQYENELNSIEKSIEKLSKPMVFVQAY